MFIHLKPQAPSQLGKETEYDKSFTPWKIIKLHIIFDLWSDDDLLRNSPCYFVTKRAYDALAKEKFTGIEFGGEVKTEVSDTFKKLYPNKELPSYYLIRIVGVPGKDDLGIEYPNKLIISKVVLLLLQEYNLSDAKISPLSLE